MQTGASEADTDMEGESATGWDKIPPFDTSNYSYSPCCLKCVRAFGPDEAAMKHVHDEKGAALDCDDKKVRVFFSTDMDGQWKAQGVSQNGVHWCPKCEATSKSAESTCKPPHSTPAPNACFHGVKASRRPTAHRQECSRHGG